MTINAIASFAEEDLDLEDLEGDLDLEEDHPIVAAEAGEEDLDLEEDRPIVVAEAGEEDRPIVAAEERRESFAEVRP